MGRLVVALAALISLSSSPSAALTLQDLNAGTAFASSDGGLTFAFDPGSVVANGTLPGSLVDYLVTPIVGGFQVSGPLAVLNGALGGLTLSYQVTPGVGLLLEGASLLVTGVAFGASAFGSAGLTLSNGAGAGALVSGFGPSVLTDSAVFAPVAGAQAVLGVQLLALGLGEVAALTSIRQTYTLIAIPEAETAALLLSGLFGLALFGAPRQSRPLRGRGPCPAPSSQKGDAFRKGTFRKGT